MTSRTAATEISTPYAEALMSVATSNNVLDPVAENVRSLLSALQDSPDLQNFLANPLMKPDLKKAVLRQIAQDSLHPYTLNFLMLLVDKGRIVLLESICQQFQERYRKLNQIVLAQVTSAIPLTDEQKEAVRQRVISITGARQVELETDLDSDLLGGVIIKIGSQVIDASLRGQLRRIGLRLTAA
ncbi:MAG: ATP synthase F1 subunit delta [Synechococcales bacterium]|nr:ATP synthase F1 subunit delta [Synechococcales bacterium]